MYLDFVEEILGILGFSLQANIRELFLSIRLS